MRKTRIAYVMMKAHTGGTKNLVMEYMRHLDKERVVVDLFCDSDSNAVPIDEVKALGGEVYLITPTKNILGNMKDMYKIFKENQYDVVHAWNSTMNIFPMRVANSAGVPVRVSECVSMANRHETIKSITKNILRQFSRLDANYYIGNSYDCGVYLFGKKAVESGKVSVFKTVINAESNAYKQELREKTRKEFGWSDKILYGFIGRYMPQKNPLFLIEIFNEIQKRQPKAHLVMIGFGDLENQMMEKVAAQGLTEKVENLGRREDIKQFYNAFDAFLLPSLYEGLPVVGLEAQCCGLPMFFSTEITKEASACDELGIFISLQDTAAVWAEKIIPIVERNMGRRRSHCDDIIKNGFDSKSESVRLLDFYMNALKKQSEK